MKDSGLTRRAFLAAVTTTAAVSAWSAPNTARVVPRKISPNEKVNVAGIGVGGKGSSDILSFLRENVVAVCDVDFAGAEETVYRLPKAKQYKDYRKMLDEMGKDIDALTIATPDHTHAPAAYMAMKLGKHVYVEKPLAHTVAEVRLLRRTAAEMGVATQMGNQGHSLDALRELTEMLRADAIGKVTEVHVWTDRPGGRWPKGGPAEAAPAQSVPRRWTGTSGSERPPSAPTTNSTPRASGAAGWISAAAVSETWAATSWTPPGSPSTCTRPRPSPWNP